MQKLYRTDFWSYAFTKRMCIGEENLNRYHPERQDSHISNQTLLQIPHHYTVRKKNQSLMPSSE